MAVMAAFAATAENSLALCDEIVDAVASNLASVFDEGRSSRGPGPGSYEDLGGGVGGNMGGGGGGAGTGKAEEYVVCQSERGCGCFSTPPPHAIIIMIVTVSPTRLCRLGWVRGRIGRQGRRPICARERHRRGPADAYHQGAARLICGDGLGFDAACGSRLDRRLPCVCPPPPHPPIACRCYSAS